MSNFKFISTPIDGVIIVEPTTYGDNRGYFMETYNHREFAEAGITSNFVQDNQSLSSKGTLRGLHRQINFPQAKLVRCYEGEVFDVCVDMRKESATYGKWYGLILSGTNNKQLYVPKGLLHGFLVLSETAVFAYKCDEFYHPEDEGGLIWDDPDLDIKWPLDEILHPVLSEKDKKLPKLREI